jgi:hypothetical protein
VTQRVIIPRESSGSSDIHVRAKRNGALLSEKTRSCVVDPILQESEPNDSRYAEADPVLTNQGYAANTGTPTDEDWYTLTLPAGSGFGITGDGQTSSIDIKGYVGTSSSPAFSVSDDGYAGGKTLTRISHTPSISLAKIELR